EFEKGLLPSVEVGSELVLGWRWIDHRQLLPFQETAGEITESLIRVRGPVLNLLKDRKLLDAEVLLDSRRLGSPEIFDGANESRILALVMKHSAAPPYGLDQFLEATSGFVQVDVLVHVVTRENVLLNGELAFFRPDDATGTVRFLNDLKRI